MTTETDKRPDPDQLLAEVRRAGERGTSGRLKIFLGMAAGVGKTYAMLQAAHQLKRQGVSVVVGWVDTHGRRDTASLLEGLEVLPRLKTPHRGSVLEELDLDLILARKPTVVLVDELAHTNAPTSRHTKRYLDVEELLRAGIDVYTTINVQHLESRAGTVQQFTRVEIQETVPDSIIDQADEIVLIDLPPEELLKRLRDGKIYPLERVEAASIHFFKKGNLTALREMALRMAAERVDRDLRRFKVLHGIEGSWKSSSRLMVAVFASPFSESLIRWTRRLADLMDATWLGVHVGADEDLSEDERALLAKNISLVSQLGGEVVSTRDSDPVAGIVRVARQHGVTQLVVGKPRGGFFRDLLRGGSLVNRLVEASEEIDVYVVAAEGIDAKRRLQKIRRFRRQKRPDLPWQQLGWVVAVAFSTWLLAAGLESYIGYLAVGILFLMAVSIAGLFLARFWIFVLALVFGVIHNFFFIPPVNTFDIAKPEDFLTLAMYFVAAASLGHLTSRLKRKEQIVRDRETRALILYDLSKALAAARSIDETAAAAVAQFQQAFGTEAAILLPQGAAPGTLTVHPVSGFLPPPQELGVAGWVAEQGLPAGRFTETLPASSGIYLPLLGRSGTLGVIALAAGSRKYFATEDRTVAETLARQVATGLERELFHKQGREYEVMVETQKLYKTLLDSVSHELKTPLAAIMGSASALRDPVAANRPETVALLSEEIYNGTVRLQRIVDNLLDMTRLESGMLRPRQEVRDVEDIVGSVLRRAEAQKGSHTTDVRVAKDLKPVVCDEVLLVQALTNVLSNAYHYTPGASPVEIDAHTGPSGRIAISVLDRGPGLPADDPKRVFEKFYRGEPERTGGVGLGLAIARGFVEVQGGEMTCGNREGGGAYFTILLPAEAAHA